MRFGRELLFAYGPWGFLNAPLVISRLDFALGLSLSLASVVITWLVTVTILRSQLAPNRALLFASLLTVTLSSVSPPSFLLAVVGAVACVCHLREIPPLDAAWCPVAVSGLAALLAQIKFSEGVVVTALALATSLVSPRARLMKVGGCVLAWVVTFLVLWGTAGQSMSDIWPWWQASIDFVIGYQGAMSLEPAASLISIVWFAMALVLAVSVLAIGWKGRAGRSGLSRVGGIVVAVGLMAFGFKQSFTRHDVQHNAAFFVIAALLLCALLYRGPHRRATALLIVLACLLASPAIFTQVRANPVEAWGSTWRTFTSDASWSATLKKARNEGQTAYSLPREMVEATRGRAVSVDPWEVSLVWAYSMKWRPMPVFQSYSAYTTYLDHLNAEAATRARSDQMIIRATTVSTQESPTLIDERNPLWESPQYTLAAVCNYRTVTADKRWMLLKKSADRCRDLSSPIAVQEVAANEPIKVPRAGADQIVTASFLPGEPDSLPSRAVSLFKGADLLYVAADGQSFRLPEALSAGPLLMALPQAAGWPAEYRGALPVRSISFSRPGTLQFRTTDLGR